MQENPAAQAVSIQGRLVKLRPVSRSDYPVVFGWRSETDTVHMLNFRRRTAPFEEFIAEIEQLLQTSEMLLVVDNSTGHAIGYALVYSIDTWDAWAWVGMYLDKEHRFKGHGGEAALLSVEWVFRWFPVRKIFTEVYDFGEHQLRLVKTMGFDEEGYHPDHFWFGDRFWGVYRMALTRDRWMDRRETFASILDVQQEFERLTDQAVKEPRDGQSSLSR